jgi:ferric-dicitrate binding protein FerR (iron transport regulator)
MHSGLGRQAAPSLWCFRPSGRAATAGRPCCCRDARLTFQAHLVSKDSLAAWQRFGELRGLVAIMAVAGSPGHSSPRRSRRLWLPLWLGIVLITAAVMLVRMVQPALKLHDACGDAVLGHGNASLLRLAHSTLPGQRTSDMASGPPYRCVLCVAAM